MTTARVFLALLPKLRDSGIRTFAEATQACRALTDALDRQYRAGWIDADTRAIASGTGACCTGSTAIRIAIASAT